MCARDDHVQYCREPNQQDRRSHDKQINVQSYTTAFQSGYEELCSLENGTTDLSKASFEAFYLCRLMSSSHWGLRQRQLSQRLMVVHLRQQLT